VYGVEAVLPLKIQIPSLRIAILEGVSEDNNHKLRLAELESLKEKKALGTTKFGALSSTLVTSIQQKGLPLLIPVWALFHYKSFCRSGAH